jgi:hypothetical protein
MPCVIAGTMATLVECERKQFVSYTDSETVSHRIHGISFGVYTDDEIRHLSLKSIHQLETFDCMGHATSGGLYDLELGKFIHVHEVILGVNYFVFAV